MLSNSFSRSMEVRTRIDSRRKDRDDDHAHRCYPAIMPDDPTTESLPERIQHAVEILVLARFAAAFFAGVRLPRLSVRAA